MMNGTQEISVRESEDLKCDDSIFNFDFDLLKGLKVLETDVQIQPTREILFLTVWKHVP